MSFEATRGSMLSNAQSLEIFESRRWYYKVFAPLVLIS